MDDEYSVREVVEPKSGKVHRLYSYRRKPCRRVVLSGHLAAQLSGYALIEKDLRSAIVWVTETEALHTDGPIRDGEQFARGQDRKKYNLIKGLFVAALTFYGKCFSRCEGRPVKLERAQLDERFRDLHDTCMKYRHNFAAHSGAEKLEFVEVALVLPQKTKKPVAPKLYLREVKSKFRELFEHVRSIANAKIQRLSEKILTEEVYPKGQAYWLK